MVIALLGVAVLITYSPQNGVILLVMAFLISPMGLPLAAIWLPSLRHILDGSFGIFLILLESLNQPVFQHVLYTVPHNRPVRRLSQHPHVQYRRVYVLSGITLILIGQLLLRHLLL